LFINIHTHHLPAVGELAIQNRFTNFETVELSGIYSIGLHPWHIDKDWQNLFEQLVQYSTHKNVVAIGESGLDKICKSDWLLQQIVFSKQIRLANQINKPLIIHCVKAWEEVLSALEKEAIKVPVVFHGFNKNILLAKRIIAAGYYLSFGKALQQDSVQQVLATVPAAQFFLETDEADLTIEQVYEYAGSALSIDLNTLSLQIQKNTTAVFGPSFIL
jgi:TatD DNase family protein